MAGDQTEDYRELIADIKRTLRVLTVLVGCCLVLSVGVGVFAWLRADEANDALCNLRTDIEQRVAQTEKFLADNPGGFAGIPAAQLRQSLDGQRRTVSSLSGLDCPG